MKRVDLRDRSLLTVFAHPDDESLACGGLLAWCAHLGARVSVCCATGGELGLTTSDGSTLPSTGAVVRRLRRRELHNAARVLGVTHVEVLDHEDGMLPWTDADRLDADIRNTIVRLRPDVVVTFGDDGLYGHPDHIAIHERTTAAVAALGADGPALYYVTMPRGGMRAVVTHVAAALAGRGAHGTAPQRILGIADADAFGAVAAPPTLVIDVGRFAAAKLAAIKCHRTQLDGDALSRVTSRDAARLLGTEQFHRAAAGSTRDAFIESFAARRPF